MFMLPTAYLVKMKIHVGEEIDEQKDPRNLQEELFNMSKKEKSK